MSDIEIIRCSWCGDDDPLHTRYHDEEWGVPVRDDDQLFAKLILDGAQAGLSWITILRKREGYYRAFDDFNAEKIARYNGHKIAELMEDAGIIRNRLKINAAITNARAYLKMREEKGSFSDYLWQFVDGETRENHFEKASQIPAESPQSIAMSKDLRKRGFKFVGPVICYAFMQAVGMINDHLVSCFRHQEVRDL